MNPAAGSLRHLVVSAIDDVPAGFGQHDVVYLGILDRIERSETIAVLSKIRRALAPGGRVIVGFMDASAVEVAIRLGVSFDGVRQIFTEERLRADLSHAGFDGVERWSGHVPWERRSALVAWASLRHDAAPGELVSVLIPARAASVWIRGAIGSVLSQELPLGMDVEVLVGVDDCPCTAASAGWVADPRVRLIESSKRVGTYVMLNTLHAEARGRFVGAMGADDAMMQGRLRNLICALRDGADAANDMMVVADDRGGETITTTAAMGTWLWRRSSFEKLGGYQPWMNAADQELVERAKKASMRMEVVDGATYLYRRHDRQASSTPEAGAFRTSMRSSIFDPKTIYVRPAVAAPIVRHPTRAVFELPDRTQWRSFTGSSPGFVLEDAALGPRYSGRVGVMIPTWKRPNMLRAAVASVLAQSRVPDRVLVVGSDEPEARAIAAANDVEYFDTPNRPLSLKHAAGLSRLDDCDVLLVVGDDDVLGDAAIDRVSRRFVRDEIVIAGFEDGFVIDGGRVLYFGGYGRARLDPVGTGRGIRKTAFERCGRSYGGQRDVGLDGHSARLILEANRSGKMERIKSDRSGFAMAVKVGKSISNGSALIGNGTAPCYSEDVAMFVESRLRQEVAQLVLTAIQRGVP